MASKSGSRDDAGVDVKEEQMDVDEETSKTNDDNQTEDGKGDESTTTETNGKESESENEESEDDDEADTEPTEPLATTRARRSNAGNRMSTLLLEEEDEFYAKNYGGFQEEEDDGDFDEDEEADEDEVEQDYDVDSDFDIDETDEIAPEHQAVDEEPKKRKSAYKEPKRKVQTGITTGTLTSTPLQKAPKPGSSATPLSPGKHRPERSFRDSTKKKTAETIKNIESVKKKRKYRNVEPQRRLTREEMLEEAKITEEENIKSLEIYQRLESEKLKKIKMIKKSIPPPFISYYSSVFTNPETKDRYSRNMCTFVGCEPMTKNSKATVKS